MDGSLQFLHTTDTGPYLSAFRKKRDLLLVFAMASVDISGRARQGVLNLVSTLELW